MADQAELVTAPTYVFSIIGDSNVQRNLVDYNCSNRDEMKSAQLIPCTSMVTFQACLPKIRPESNILILSCLSNFLRDSESSTDSSSRMTTVLEKFRSIIFPYVDANPDLFVMVAPPQFSRSPMWYSESIVLACQLLKSVVFDHSTFDNLQLLPAHSSQVPV